MSSLEALVLGAVQGLTEFIPVSSSGHLVLVPEALGWDQPGEQRLAFDVLLHAASLVALLVYFRAELFGLVRGSFRGDPSARRMVGLLVLGTVPAGVAGLTLSEFFEDRFDDAPAAALMLFVTAAILVAAELALAFHRKRQHSATGMRHLDDLRPPDAVVIGVAQAVAILPGISRSGSTIGAGLALRIERGDAARFAFLLAIPALAGAALVELPDLEASLGLGAGVTGFVSSLVTSYAAIAGLIRYLKTRTLYPFAVYCVIAGAFFYLVV